MGGKETFSNSNIIPEEGTATMEVVSESHKHEHPTTLAPENPENGTDNFNGNEEESGDSSSSNNGINSHTCNCSNIKSNNCNSSSGSTSMGPEAAHTPSLSPSLSPPFMWDTDDFVVVHTCSTHDSLNTSSFPTDVVIVCAEQDSLTTMMSGSDPEVIDTDQAEAESYLASSSSAKKWYTYGSRPSREWLYSSGLEVDPYGSVVVNASFMAAENVYAAGDVASYPVPYIDNGPYPFPPLPSPVVGHAMTSAAANSSGSVPNKHRTDTHPCAEQRHKSSSSSGSNSGSGSIYSGNSSAQGYAQGQGQGQGQGSGSSSRVMYKRGTAVGLQSAVTSGALAGRNMCGVRDIGQDQGKGKGINGTFSGEHPATTAIAATSGMRAYTSNSSASSSMPSHDYSYQAVSVFSGLYFHFYGECTNRYASHSFWLKPPKASTDNVAKLVPEQRQQKQTKSLLGQGLIFYVDAYGVVKGVAVCGNGHQGRGTQSVHNLAIPSPGVNSAPATTNVSENENESTARHSTSTTMGSSSDISFSRLREVPVSGLPPVSGSGSVSPGLLVGSRIPPMYSSNTRLKSLYLQHQAECLFAHPFAIDMSSSTSIQASSTPTKPSTCTSTSTMMNTKKTDTHMHKKSSVPFNFKVIYAPPQALSGSAMTGSRSLLSNQGLSFQASPVSTQYRYLLQSSVATENIFYRRHRRRDIDKFQS